MLFVSSLAFLALATAAPVLEERQGTCTPAQRIAGVRQEIKTISSHSAADAALIPLAPLASRTFVVTPAEAGGVVGAPVNAGVTAAGVRLALLALAVLIDANVPGGEVDGARYQVNNNNTVTVDYIQTNRLALPRVNVREIHTFDPTTCLITNIFGYVNGNLIDPTPLVNEDDPDPFVPSLLELVPILTQLNTLV